MAAGSSKKRFVLIQKKILSMATFVSKILKVVSKKNVCFPIPQGGENGEFRVFSVLNTCPPFLVSTGSTTKALPTELSSSNCANSIKEAFLKRNFTFIQCPSQRECEAPDTFLTRLQAVFNQHSVIVALERLPRTSKILYEHLCTTLLVSCTVCCVHHLLSYELQVRSTFIVVLG